MAKNRQPENNKKTKTSKGRAVYWVIALLLLLFAGSLYVLEKLQHGGRVPWCFPLKLSGKKEDLSKQSLKLEEALNGVLSANGVVDSDLVTSSNSQEEENGESWYHFEKQIKLPARIDISKLQQALAQAVDSAGGQVWENQLENKNKEKILTFKAGFQKQVTHYLVIGQLLSALPAAAQPALPAGPRVALLIDDVGNNSDIEKLTELGIPLTVAILPRLKYSAFSAEYAQKKNSLPSCISL